MRSLGLVMLVAGLGACGGAAPAPPTTATVVQAPGLARQVPAPPPEAADGRVLVAPSWRWLVEIDQAPATVKMLAPYVAALRELFGADSELAMGTALKVAQHTERVSLFASDTRWVAALAGVASLASLRAALEAATSQPAEPWDYRRIEGLKSRGGTGALFKGGAALVGAEAQVRAAVDAAYAGEKTWRMPADALQGLYDALRASPARVVGLPSAPERQAGAAALRSLDVRLAEACLRLQALGLGLSMNEEAGRLRLNSQLVFASAQDAATVLERVRRLTRRTTLKITARLMGLGFLLSRLRIEARDKRVFIGHEMTPAELRRLVKVVQGLRKAA